MSPSPQRCCICQRLCYYRCGQKTTREGEDTPNLNHGCGFHGEELQSRRPRSPRGTCPALPGAASPFLSNSLNSRVVGIDEIRPYENRVRSRTRKALKKLARSIDRFGQVVPVVVDQDYEVVDGHSVLEAL